MFKGLFDLIRGRSSVSEGDRPKYYLNEKALNRVFEYPDPAIPGEQNLIRREAGEIYLPSGRIVAGDPVCFTDSSPFTVAAAAGRYPVAIFEAEYPPNNSPGYVDRRVALAAVYFSDRRAERWEMAVVDGQKLRKLKKGDYYGYPVDAGTGGFMSQEAAEAYMAEDPLGEDSTTDQLLDLFQEACESDYTAPLNHIMDEDRGLNIIVFSSGLGDGSYPSYFGCDAEGRVCCLVTDFFILASPDED